MKRVAALAALAAAIPLACGCEDRRDAELRAARAEADGRESPARGNRPEALMVRFQAARGTGFAREAWEVEILQLGPDVRLRGSLRRGTDVVPVLGSLDEVSYLDLWQWLAGLPLDGFRVVEDSSAAGDGWTRRLEVDIVLGPERRVRSRNAWQRPPRDATWLSELEGTMHALAVEHAASQDSIAAPDSTRDAVEKAVQEAMSDLAGRRSGDGTATP
jgi:hypothetical protein